MLEAGTVMLSIKLSALSKLLFVLVSRISGATFNAVPPHLHLLGSNSLDLDGVGTILVNHLPFLH